MATTIHAPRRAGASSAATAVAPAHQPTARPAPRPSRPPLRVVDRQPRRARIGLIGVAAITVVFGLLFGLVFFQTLLVQNQSRLDQLNSQIRAEQAQYQSLRLQVAQLEAPSRIVDAATTKLGMVSPPGTGYLTPSATDAAATASTAAAASAAGTDPGSGGSDWPTVKPFLSVR